MLTTYIRADPRTCQGLSLSRSNGESCEILLRIFHSEDME